MIAKESYKPTDLKEWSVGKDALRIVPVKEKYPTFVLNYPDLVSTRLDKVGRYFTAKVFAKGQPDPNKEYLAFQWKTQEPAEQVVKMFESIRLAGEPRDGGRVGAAGTAHADVVHVIPLHSTTIAPSATKEEGRGGTGGPGEDPLLVRLRGEAGGGAVQKMAGIVEIALQGGDARLAGVECHRRQTPIAEALHQLL